MLTRRGIVKIEAMKSRDYWNSNLDTDNLSRDGGSAHDNLERSLAFADTPEFEWLRGRLDDLRGHCLVDLGGGVGMHALIWARGGARVVVADLALERMKALRRLARREGLADRVDFVVGGAEALPFAAESVGAVFTKSVLIHTDLPRTSREIHRVLRAGGQGLFIEPLSLNPLIRFYRRWFGPKIWRSITRYFDRDCIEELRAPFGRLRWKPFYLLSAGSFIWQYKSKNLSRFRRSLRFWMRWDRRLARRWPRLESWSWFAAIEVRKETSKTGD